MSPTSAAIRSHSASRCILQGLWYSATILLILGAHELGHYLACRYYQVDASLPFFIPMPLVLTGTLGAFIRIREPIPTKRMLFDIGIAGPLAGLRVRGAGALHRRRDVAGGARAAESRRVRSRRAAAVPGRDVADLGIDRRTATRSTCIRWHLPRGSDCSRPR